MKSSNPRPDAVSDVRRPTGDAPRMGSEYADAQTYLHRPARGPNGSARRKPGKDPQHGSNDSDFGIPDQRHE